MATRKAVELAGRLTSLETELRHWEQEAAGGGPLERQRTQIHAVAGMLAVPIAALRAALDGPAAPEDAEPAIADLGRVWDAFRGKLAQRHVVHFAGYLSGADALACRCHAPARRRGAPREAPLVFFGDESSRLTPLRQIPVPLIGLPWFQVEHLPDMPIVAHGVGREVETDLALGPALDAALAGALDRADAPEEQRRAWGARRGDAFADVFGTLALGPAYGRTLIDAEPRTAADPAWRTLRVRLSAATLELLGFESEAARLRGGTPAGLEAEVAAALVGGPYAAVGDGPLTDLLAFPPDAHERARRTAHDALQRRAPTATDACELVAAARLAFDAAPRGFGAAEVAPRLLRRIRECQPPPAPTGADGEAHAQRAGERLAAHLAARHARPA